MKDQNNSREQMVREMALLRRQLEELRKSEIERSKELNCVFAFSNIIQDPDLPVTKIAERMVEIIPSGWLHPEATCARLTLEEQTFQTVNFTETPWKQTADITYREEKIGTVEIFYTGETTSDPFLPEEQALLDDLAKRMERVIRRKHAEETLREREGYYREVFEKSNYGMAVTDLEGHFLDCNRAFLSLLGYASAEELQTLSYDDITPPEYREEEKRLIVEQTGEAGYSEGYEKEFMQRGGDRIPVIIKVWLRQDMNRRPVGMYIIARDMTKRKISQESLRKRELELADKSTHLEEVNTALRVLLKHREEDKGELEERIISNVQKLIIPYLEKLKKSHLGTRDAAYLQIIETNINNIISPFLSRLSVKYSHLSSREIQVAHLVKEGKTTKEISDLLGVSTKTIDLYRGGIRRKLGLKDKKINMKSHLTSLL
jgi:PAS domain S-box-containing protein